LAFVLRSYVRLLLREYDFNETQINTLIEAGCTALTIMTVIANEQLPQGCHLRKTDIDAFMNISAELKQCIGKQQQ